MDWHISRSKESATPKNLPQANRTGKYALYCTLQLTWTDKGDLKSKHLKTTALLIDAVQTHTCWANRANPRGRGRAPGAVRRQRATEPGAARSSEPPGAARAPPNVINTICSGCTEAPCDSGYRRQNTGNDSYRARAVVSGYVAICHSNPRPGHNPYFYSSLGLQNLRFN